MKRLPDPCTVAEAARWLGVSTQAVRLRIKKRKLALLPALAGAGTHLARQDVEAWRSERIMAARKVLAR